ncbi:phytanoyl-CoA dioxygenase family protein [Luminiphilus sp.]|nr:phytanoyl-CoA dioxygenase family protein [Luminiphilus sp.]
MNASPIHEALHADHQFNVYGYQVLRLDTSQEFFAFQKRFSKYIWEQIQLCVGVEVQNVEFDLEYFHQHLEGLSLEHHDFIKACGRNLPESFSKHSFIEGIVEAASRCMGYELKLFMDKVEFRVVRPHQEDNNPFHRDHWFPYFTPLLNIYAPLSGNYYDSAMPLVPGSHKWSDEDVVPTFTYEDIKLGRKSVKNGVAYSVPEVLTSKQPLVPHRPDVMLGDVMCFSPLMVHGGGTNKSIHTRFSLELRLERV